MRLEQALTEIISNALDAMSNGGRLEIAAQSQVGEAGADGVLLEIADSGSGIAAEILPNLCEPFFTTRPEGTGLGLAIAKRYVEAAAGFLDVALRDGEAEARALGSRREERLAPGWQDLPPNFPPRIGASGAKPRGPLPAPPGPR